MVRPIHRSTQIPQALSALAGCRRRPCTAVLPRAVPPPPLLLPRAARPSSSSSSLKSPPPPPHSPSSPPPPSHRRWPRRGNCSPDAAPQQIPPPLPPPPYASPPATAPASSATASQAGFFTRPGRLIKEMAKSDVEKLFSGFSKTRENLSVVDELLTYWNLADTDRVLDELEEALLVSNFGPRISFRIVDTLRDGKLKSGSEIKEALKRCILELLTSK